MSDSIKITQMKRISLGHGKAEIVIEEKNDTFNISIQENVSNTVRIGIEENWGCHFKYLNDFRGEQTKTLEKT